MEEQVLRAKTIQALKCVDSNLSFTSANTGLYPSTSAELRFSRRIEFYGRRLYPNVREHVVPVQLGAHMGCSKAPCGVQEQCPWKLWLFHRSQIFK